MIILCLSLFLRMNHGPHPSTNRNIITSWDLAMTIFSSTTVCCGLWLPIQLSIVSSSQKICFYGIGMSTQCPTPNLEDQGVSLGLEPLAMTIVPWIMKTKVVRNFYSRILFLDWNQLFIIWIWIELYAIEIDPWNVLQKWIVLLRSSRNSLCKQENTLQAYLH
jgi:hypothetical protein